MVAGPTGNNLYMLYFFEYLVSTLTKYISSKSVFVNTIFKRVAHNGWLLVNFLKHVVAVTRFVTRIVLDIRLNHFAFNSVTFFIEDFNVATRNLCHIAFF